MIESSFLRSEVDMETRRSDSSADSACQHQALCGVGPIRYPPPFGLHCRAIISGGATGKIIVFEGKNN